MERTVKFFASRSNLANVLSPRSGRVRIGPSPVPERLKRSAGATRPSATFEDRIEYWIESPPKFGEARSRLYRRRFLQVNTHFSALFEIYKISIPSHRSNLENSVKNRHQFCEIEYWKFNRNITIFAGKLLFLAEIEVKFCRNFANVLQNIQTQWGLQKIWKILRKFGENSGTDRKIQSQNWKIQFGP